MTTPTLADVQGGVTTRLGLALFMALLTGCVAPHPRPLLLSVDAVPGLEAERVLMPCNGSLECWARDPGQIEPWLERFHASLRGQRNVTVIGVSRGGYLALRMAAWPEVGQIVALSPVTDLSRLHEFAGVALPASAKLDPLALSHVRAFIQIGNADDRVGTQEAMRYATEAMNPRLTVMVGESPGHTLMPLDDARRWLDQE